MRESNSCNRHNHHSQEECECNPYQSPYDCDSYDPTPQPSCDCDSCDPVSQPECCIGPPGKPGFSAYQLALANGFIGTLSQWLASLQGPIGPAGPAGPAGGPVGPTGATAPHILGKPTIK